MTKIKLSNFDDPESNMDESKEFKSLSKSLSNNQSDNAF